MFLPDTVSDEVTSSPSRGADEEFRQHVIDSLRHGRPSHATVTALVTTLNSSHVLLIRHRRSGRWQPPGGHCEPGDESMFGAAEREAREETGLVGLRPRGAVRVRPGVVECHPDAQVHFDIVFWFTADMQVLPDPPLEVLACGWYALNELPSPMAEDTRALIDRVR